MSSAPRRFSEEELADLLERARVKNAARSVTGMLQHDDGNFIQYLEGERDTVEALFDLISQDARHRNNLRMSDGEISQRMFPEWSMGCQELAASELAGHRVFDLSRDSLEARLDPDLPRAVIAMMRQFYRASDRFAPA